MADPSHRPREKGLIERRLQARRLDYNLDYLIQLGSTLDPPWGWEQPA